jgi:hypothetical protein
MGRDAPAQVGRVRMAGRLWPGNWTPSSVTFSLMMTFAMPILLWEAVVGGHRRGHRDLGNRAPAGLRPSDRPATSTRSNAETRQTPRRKAS